MPADRCELVALDLKVAERLRQQKPEAFELERAAGRARALSDPTRLMLAAALREVDELCVCDLAWIAERSQNLVSHHLGALRRAALVRSRREGKMAKYALTEEGRRLVDAVRAADVVLER